MLDLCRISLDNKDKNERERERERRKKVFSRAILDDIHRQTLHSTLKRFLHNNKIQRSRNDKKIARLSLVSHRLRTLTSTLIARRKLGQFSLSLSLSLCFPTSRKRNEAITRFEARNSFVLAFSMHFLIARSIFSFYPVFLFSFLFFFPSPLLAGDPIQLSSSREN